MKKFKKINSEEIDRLVEEKIKRMMPEIINELQKGKALNI